MSRVLITGTRNLVPGLLDKMQDVLIDWTDTTKRDCLVLVHGAHWSGVDYLVPALAALMRDELPNRFVDHEPHPADWTAQGRAAGPLRNQAMVDLGASLCLAFPQGESPGTRDCIRRARKANIEVVITEL